ncbi:glycosyltransferase family 4 protein [Geotalea uraniireducens]|uniref:Glycosyl transferase, group 1 n=1 Tax=Geotalea uraniireducens (strain Rf4) TaxID=351605 RepID=A5G4P8_GEOUR|nr:glycosyltransferase family 4 protein [Geotalea uraniireducens]ABQ26766.1 glycosyl transferase, group 1 [Geotalea uraniireducens Rf4]
MKILTVNRNYFVTGGPEKYMFSLLRNMPQHEFIPFCVRFAKNQSSPYERYFVNPPVGKDMVYYDQHQIGVLKKLLYAGKSLYSFEAKRKLEDLIRDTRPDAALFLNAVYFSDSIIDACRRHDVPIIWRMSDFHKVCANYLLFRDGKICEECLENGLIMALCHKCGGYQHSLAAALVKVAGMWLSRYRRIYDHVHYFVTPSAFTREKMIQGGFAPDKIVHIPTFVETGDGESYPAKNPNGILYAGRLSPEKGIEVLLEAFARLRNRDAVLSIAGDANSDYARSLIASVPAASKDRIKFLGFQDQESLARLYSQNLLFVVPSVWYENQPNVLLEGMARGRAAIVPCLGSLMETVIEGVTGYHYKPGNSPELADKIDRLLENPRLASEMGRRARTHVLEHHAASVHIAALGELFKSCLGKGKNRTGIQP